MNEQSWLENNYPLAMLTHLTHEDADFGHLGTEIVPREQPLASARKLRLVACACCRLPRVWGQFGEESKIHVLAAEGYADDRAAHEAVFLASAIQAPEVRLEATRGSIGEYIAATLACWAVDTNPALGGRVRAAVSDEYGQLVVPHHLMAAIVRDIIGNPWQAAASPMPPGCGIRSDLWGLAYSLAVAAYEERNEDGTLDNFRLALVADALEEAGVASTGDEAILGMYICEKCSGPPFIPQLGAGIKCPACQGEFCRKQRQRDLPHPVLAALRSPGPHYRGQWALDLVLGKE